MSNCRACSLGSDDLVECRHHGGTKDCPMSCVLIHGGRFLTLPPGGRTFNPGELKAGDRVVFGDPEVGS